MIDRRQFVAAATSAPWVRRESPPRRPNVLFILCDQWRRQTLPSSGDEDLVAPNLARLARRGVHFSRAYTCHPVCTPSRAATLTGRYPHACRMPHNNLRLPVEERCIAAELRQAGYRTGYIGKWHLDGDALPGYVPPGPRRHGFDFWAAFNRGHFYFQSTYYRDSPDPIQPGGFEPDYQTSLAIDFLRGNSHAPFFLYLSWGPPHTPRTPPQEAARLYAARRFHLRANVPESYAETARQEYAGYYGLCSALDRNLGRILDELERLRLAEDTIVVFTADHGDMLGSHGLEYPGVPYEESAGIPLLIAWPRRFQGGRTNDTLICNVDYVPTLLRWCGLDPPESVQGVDLSRLILTGAGTRPESVYVQGNLGRPEEWRMVVRGLDKLIVDAALKPTHLYNLGEDPFELDNRVGAGAERLKTDELRALLRHWIYRTSDRVPYPFRTGERVPR